MQEITTTSTTPPRTGPVETADVVELLAALRESLRPEQPRPVLHLVDGGAA